MFFFRFLFFLVIIIFLLTVLIRSFSRIVFSVFNKRFNPNATNRNKVQVNKTAKKEKLIDADEGEYIDFEEIKD